MAYLGGILELGPAGNRARLPDAVIKAQAAKAGRGRSKLDHRLVVHRGDQSRDWSARVEKVGGGGGIIEFHSKGAGDVKSAGGDSPITGAGKQHKH